MPPAGEPYRVSNAWDAEPLGNGHGIVFRRPHQVFRNRSRLPWAKGMDVKPGLGHHDGERNVVVCENTSRLGIYSGQSEQT